MQINFKGHYKARQLLMPVHEVELVWKAFHNPKIA